MLFQKLYSVFSRDAYIIKKKIHNTIFSNSCKNIDYMWNIAATLIAYTMIHINTLLL